MSTQTLWLIVGTSACAVLLVAVAVIGVIALLSWRQEQADKPPTPVPVPPRSGSPFAPKWLRDRNERIVRERQERHG